MPYIKNEDKQRFKSALNALYAPRNAGELNYLLTKIVHEYIEYKRIENGQSNGNYTANYQAYNDAMGALEGCKLELYRRRIAPYEDVKINENGDV